MSEQKFLKGFYAKDPHPNAPDFIKYQLFIKLDEAVKGLSEISGDTINVDLKISKGGKPYLTINEYKKDESDSQNPPAEEEQEDDDDLPF